MPSRFGFQPGEVAQSGQSTIGNTLWDAVFKRCLNGTTELVAYVEGSELAEFFAKALNDALAQPTCDQPTVHILHQGWPLCNFSTKVPGEWPANHIWAPMGSSMANCAQCLAVEKLPRVPDSDS